MPNALLPQLEAGIVVSSAGQPKSLMFVVAFLEAPRATARKNMWELRCLGVPVTFEGIPLVERGDVNVATGCAPIEPLVDDLDALLAGGLSFDDTAALFREVLIKVWQLGHAIGPFETQALAACHPRAPCA